MFVHIFAILCFHHQSNEVGGNDHMEMEGMKQSLDLLEQNGLEVDYMVTERQPQILNHLMERKIPQLHDVWVLEKGTCLSEMIC